MARQAYLIRCAGYHSEIGLRRFVSASASVRVAGLFYVFHAADQTSNRSLEMTTCRQVAYFIGASYSRESLCARPNGFARAASVLARQELVDDRQLVPLACDTRLGSANKTWS